MESERTMPQGKPIFPDFQQKNPLLVGLASVVVGVFVLNAISWQGSVQSHTLMEALSTLLALVIGGIALVRYYSKKEIMFLLIGAGFLGTAFLDGYHAMVTSAHLNPHMPSELPSLIPWSWVASRQFLSILLLASWLGWRSEQRYGKIGPRGEWVTYVSVSVFTIVCFLFFALVPLPDAHIPGLFFPRHWEFISAFFFLLALAGHLHKGEWMSNSFEFWLVLSLLVSVVGQGFFMPRSAGIFDPEFNAAHLLKIISYAFVLTGLAVNMYKMYLAVEQNEEHISAIMETAIDAYFTIDDKGIVTSVDSAGEAIFGYSSQELVGQNVKILMPGEHRKKHDSYIQAYNETGIAKIIGIGRDVVGRRKDGTHFPIHLRISELPSTLGEKGFVATVQDITGRKLAERRIELLRKTADGANAAKDFKEALAICLDTVCEFTKWPVGHAYVSSDEDPSLMVSADIWHFENPMDFDDLVRVEKETNFKSGEGARAQVLKIGKPVWVESLRKSRNFHRADNLDDLKLSAAFALPVHAEGRVIAILEFLQVDTVKPDDLMLESLSHIGKQLSLVYDRDRQKLALNESEQRFRDFADSASDWFWEMDETLRLTYLSRSFAVVSGGILPEDIIGHTHEELAWCDKDSGKWKSHQAVLEAHKPFKNLEFPFQKPEQENRHWSISGRPVFAEDGAFRGYRGVGHDVTEEKRNQEELSHHRDHLEALVAERTTETKIQARRLQMALAQEKKQNETQREFVAMVSHEFRTPLSIIDGTAQRVLRRPELMTEEELPIRMQKIRDAVVRMTGLVEDTLSRASMDAGMIKFKGEEIDLCKLIQETCVRQEGVSKEHKISVDLAGISSLIWGDQKLLDQVFTNLLSNAVKYSPEGRRVDVKGWMENDSTCVVSVRDFGLGIPEKEIPKLFERYFRASTASGIAGTGIGLNLANELVKMHDGSIDVESTVDEGSKFTVQLPIQPYGQRKTNDSPKTWAAPRNPELDPEGPGGNSLAPFKCM